MIGDAPSAKPLRGCRMFDSALICSAFFGIVDWLLGRGVREASRMCGEQRASSEVVQLREICAE